MAAWRCSFLADPFDLELGTSDWGKMGGQRWKWVWGVDWTFCPSLGTPGHVGSANFQTGDCYREGREEMGKR